MAHEYEPQFLSSQILTHGDQSSYPELDKATTYKDFDRDEIPDKMDGDIDNDGVTNYLDQYPFDINKRGKDKDADGIPDFVDIEGEVGEVQEELAQKKGIVLVFDGARFSDKEIEIIRGEFIEKSFSDLEDFSKLKTIIKRKDEGDNRAHYNHFWNAIEFFPNEYHKSTINFTHTLVHETFHALAYQNIKAFKEFSTEMGWRKELNYGVRGYRYGEHFFSDFDLRHDSDKTGVLSSPNFPSDYSKTGPHEMFAEVGTASLLIKEKSKFDESRYHNLKEFKESEALSWMNNFFQSLN